MSDPNPKEFLNNFENFVESISENKTQFPFIKNDRKCHLLFSPKISSIW